jgi:hypothetical protein
MMHHFRKVYLDLVSSPFQRDIVQLICLRELTSHHIVLQPLAPAGSSIGNL